MKTELNPLRHYYLYAKGWYIKSDDLFADLKQIHAQWCAVSAEHLDRCHVVTKLLELAYVHIKACSDDRLFVEFVNDIHPENMWKICSLVQGKDDDHYARVVRKCLSILCLTSKEQFPFDLGKPDYSILPKSEH